MWFNFSIDWIFLWYCGWTLTLLRVNWGKAPRQPSSPPDVPHCGFHLMNQYYWLVLLLALRFSMFVRHCNVMVAEKFPYIPYSLRLKESNQTLFFGEDLRLRFFFNSVYTMNLVIIVSGLPGNLKILMIFVKLLILFVIILMIFMKIFSTISTFSITVVNLAVGRFPGFSECRQKCFSSSPPSLEKD